MIEKNKIVRNYWITTGSSLEKEFVLRRLNSELGFSKINPDYLIHKAFSTYRKSKWIRQAFTKTKSEVSGGGKKPWPQKGRGRARVGSIRSPLWRGGGVCFGPKPSVHNLKLNNREYDHACRVLLFEKQKSIIPISLLEGIKLLKERSNKNLIVGKTKTSKYLISEILEKNNINPIEIIGNKLITIAVTSEEFKLLEKSLFLQGINNIPKVRLISEKDLTINDLIRSKYLFITALCCHNLTQQNLSWKKIKS